MEYFKGGRRGVLKFEHPRANKRGYVREDDLIAEKALGKPLPFGTLVHHHTPEQLVVCQDQTYHMLLHRRQRAFETCGHANWRKCNFCHQYDIPEKLSLPKKPRGQTYHKSCATEYARGKRVDSLRGVLT